MGDAGMCYDHGYYCPENDDRGCPFCTINKLEQRIAEMEGEGYVTAAEYLNDSELRDAIDHVIYTIEIGDRASNMLPEHIQALYRYFENTAQPASRLVGQMERVDFLIQETLGLFAITCKEEADDNSYDAYVKNRRELAKIIAEAARK